FAPWGSARRGRPCTIADGACETQTKPAGSRHRDQLGVQMNVLIVALATISVGLLASDSTIAATAGKSGITARTFLSLTRTAQELYVAGITDALDEAGLLRCPDGTSYAQVITLAEASIYR